MKIGWATIKQADDFLYLWHDNANWSFVSKAPKIAGTISQGSDANLLVGTGTTFTTSLVVGDYIDVDNNILQVKIITDDTHISVYPNAEVGEGSIGYKLTSGQAMERAAVYLEKIKLLTSSYNQLVSSTFFNIPADEESINLINAQSLNALNLKSNPKNRHAENIQAGIKAYSIGDMSFTYGESSDKNKNEFSREVNNFMKAYTHFNRTFQISRGASPVGELPILNPESYQTVIWGLKIWL
jgi:hypothetical protein